MYCPSSPRDAKRTRDEKEEALRGPFCLFMSIIIDGREKNSASNGGELYSISAYVCALVLTTGPLGEKAGWQVGRHGKVIVG